MCDCTHADASSASTNTRARDLSAQLDENSPANANSSSNFDAKLNSPQPVSSQQHDPVTTASLRTHADPEVVAGLSPNMDTSANTIQFLHLNVEENGLFIHGNTLVGTSFQPGEEVSIALFNGTAVITTDQQKRALIKSSQELQLRQDELKEDFSEGIVQLLKALCQSVLNDVSPQKEPLPQGYFEKRLKPSSAKPDSPSVT